MDSNPLIEVPMFQSTEAVSKPVPVSDERSKAFFAGARDRWLMLQHCAFCDTWSFPMRERCPSCFNPALKWRAASGRGTLYTFTMFHQSMDSGFAAHVPYNIAQVALDEGVRMTSNFVGIDNAEGADRRVEVMNERPAVLRLLRASS